MKYKRKLEITYIISSIFQNTCFILIGIVITMEILSMLFKGLVLLIIFITGIIMMIISQGCLLEIQECGKDEK